MPELMVPDSENEMIIKSPDGTLWKITIDDNGIVETVKVV